MKQFSKELGKVSITPKGNWDSSITNERLDIVYDRRNNQAYIAKQDVPIGVDIDNREYWQPLNVSGYADNNFINLTAENENGTITAYESLEEAVATIFPINRRVGATLSFYNLNSDRLDRQAEFELWQFNSTDLANWENKDYWNNIYYNWNVFAGWYIDADALKNHVEIPNVGQYAYVGSNLNDAILYQCRTNGTWTNTGIKVRNYISVVVKGNITIGENGNWFSDGEDTGIPATPAVDEQLDNIITKHESLSRTVQGIAVTGGASTATNVTYNNDSSGLNAENTQDAIDELQDSKVDKTSILQELGEAENKIMSQKAVKTELDKKANKADMVVELAKKANTEDVDVKLDKKFDKESVAQKSGNSEELVMSQKAVSDKLSDLSSVVDKTTIKDEEGTVVETPFHYIQNEEFIFAKVDAEDKLLFGIQWDGTPVFGKTSAVEDRLQSQVNLLADKITTILGDDDTTSVIDTLKELKDFFANIDNTESLANILEDINRISIKDETGEILDTPFRVIENEEWACALVDKNNIIVYGIYRETGKTYHPKNEMFHVEENDEFSLLILDNRNKILASIRREDGYVYVSKAKWLDDIEYIKKQLVDIQNNTNKNVIVYDIDWELGKYLINNKDIKANEKSYISQKIYVKAGERVLYILPPNFLYRSVYQHPSNINNCRIHIGSVGTILNEDGYVAVSVTDLSGEKPDVTKLSGKVVVLPAKANGEYDVTFSAVDSNSYDKSKSDLVLSENIERYINAAINLKENSKVFLYDGTYNINETINSSSVSKGNDCIIFKQPFYYEDSGYFPYKSLFFLKGNDMYSTILNVTGDISFQGENVSILSLLNKDDDSSLYGNIKNTLSVSYINIICNYRLPIIAIDGQNFGCMNCRNLHIESDKRDISGDYPRIWNEPRTKGLVGIRGIKGSNKGVNNYIKHVIVIKMDIGYDITGEHFVIEDCLAHQCSNGFSFGMHPTKGQQEHPNILIGCSVEHCQRVGQLSLQGCKTIEELNALGKSKKQVLIIQGMSFEAVWFSVGYNGYEDGAHDTLGFEELIDGVTCGEISVEYFKNAMFTNGGSNMEVKKFKKY